MGLLKREIESSTCILVQTTPHWLIYDKRLKEQQEINNKRGLAIVITVSNKFGVKQLMANSLQFGETVKKVEKF